MHQPVDDDDILGTAIRTKAILLAEYFITLSLYHGNGVNVNYHDIAELEKLKDNEFLYVKERKLSGEDAMVYLMDKFISVNFIRLTSYVLRWHTCFEYAPDNYLTVELGYSAPGVVDFVCVEVTNHGEITTNYVLYDDNELIIHNDTDTVKFYETVENIIKMFITDKNKGTLDDMCRHFSEKLGAPHVHVPIESSVTFS